jgi:tetratricopeptide (TPR) repeat protein
MSTLVEELEQARRALAAHEPAHAGHHVAEALMHDPESVPALALFERVLAAEPHPERLFADASYVAEVAARAYVLAHLGKRGDAISLLLRVLTSFPGLGYERWAERWILAGTSPLDWGVAARFVVALIEPTMGVLRPRAAERAGLERLVPLVLALAAAPGIAGNPTFLALASGLCRRAGRLTEAIQLVERGAAEPAGTAMRTALAHARRAAGDAVRAEALFESCHSLEPETSFLMEIVRCRLDDGRYREALAAYERFITAGGDARDPEIAALADWLRARVEDRPGSPLSRALGARASADDFVLATRDVDHGWLRVPHEASLDVLAQLPPRARGDEPLRLQLGVSSLEAPSARLALALALTDEARVDVVDYGVTEVPAPDPRALAGSPMWRTWSYDPERGPGAVEQALAPPTAAVAAAVAALAARPYALSRWWLQANELAERLGAAAVSDLVATMVWPSPPPAGVAAPEWVRRVQVAAALCLARLERAGRGALLDLLNGPIDWVCDAAALALVEAALDEPALLDDVAGALERLQDRLPESGYWFTRSTVPLLYLRLPGRDAPRRQRMQEAWQAEAAVASEGG